MLVDGLSTPVRLAGGTDRNLGDIATNQWQTNIYTRTFFDENRDGVSPGRRSRACRWYPRTSASVTAASRTSTIPISNGNASFNEIFPLFSWYVIETDSTRYKNTGTHVVYDAGGPADGTCSGNQLAPCGSSAIGQFMANTVRGRLRCRQICACLARSTARTRTAPVSRSMVGRPPASALPTTHRPRRSSLGCERRLAGILGPEQLPRIR